MVRNVAPIAILALTCGALACGGPATLIAPSSPPLPSTSSGGVTATPPPTRALRIAGVVSDSTNSPVAGATVTLWDTSYTAVTGAAGAFDMVVQVREGDRSFWVTVQKPGFETSELARSVDGAETTSLRLHQIRTINLGESLQGTVGPDDSACGYHWGYVCRRVRVRSTSSGVITVEVVSDDVQRFGMLKGPAGFPQTLERRMPLPVTAGAEVSIDVAADGPLNAPSGFTLNASLTPE